MDAHEAIEQVAREGYSRLLALLASRTFDVMAAEDALGEAFHAALRQWPGEGIPQSPEAWLLAVARRRLLDTQRRQDTREAAAAQLRVAVELQSLAAADDADRGNAVPDERLKLLFVCTHPSIDAAARTPLMLQVVLGLDAAKIASAFLVAPAAMSQRLVRSKDKIRSARIPFVVPEGTDLVARLDSVLEAVYAAYGAGWDDTMPPGHQHRGLTSEALWLARVLAQLLPDEPECLGLRSLLLHCEARRPARRDEHGDFVPLARQDTARWNRAAIVEAESLLKRASAFQRPGRFQLEAAIQSAHASRAFTGTTPWVGILGLYRELLGIMPTVGAQVAYAGALLQTGNPLAALCELESLSQKEVANYQPWWAGKAHAMLALGDREQARAAFQRAAGLAEDEAVRRFLLGKMPTQP